ncbi:DUF3742 family protein [Pseudomonas protegens]|jgi:hypothetical protein|uniref:DUF3742 family protein n=1 Tax=Pseudomonas protegens TaxID=380021 RepID=A0ABY2VDX3_9PSED|nr:DUF3742 family protein [Pseudomonas protegens]QEZ54438.1 DUF3742 family protein [Pseudomonas protegens]QEZ59357.1 DUF3742 family protein [Pseudomonas protegens]QEZ65725.1 DUF3742 family protein [Pseudomonas protegens]QIC30374.1 DUF3742 family protein [Pseudomonas protegens]TMM62509.1 DUF3742 family protein [Pseudomonas protegens]
MTAAATTTFAHRLGSALGTAARFWLHDRNPMVRWIKRLIVLVVLGAILVNSFSWILSALLTTISLGIGLYAFSKIDTDSLSSAVEVTPSVEDSEHMHQSQDDAMWRDGPEGWGYYRVDDVRLDF